MQQLEGEFSRQAGAAAGWVKGAVSNVIAEHLLVPSLNGLSKRYPRLRIDHKVDDRVAGMAHD